MLDASRRAGVRRFVHLSSVAVYGDSTSGVLSESAPSRATPNTYGSMKERQDELVADAARKGLSAAILCPPNIGGSYSAFLLEIVQAIRRWEFALVDDGSLPCELVDVENLVHAIRLALDIPSIDSQRIFVTDGAGLTWRQLTELLAPLADRPAPLPALSGDQSADVAPEGAPARPSLLSGLRQLVSSDVRSALRQDPLLAAAEKHLKSGIRRIPSLERALRRQIEGGPELPSASTSLYLSERLVRQQRRNTRYALDRARSVLGYAPVVSPVESLNAFRRWYSEYVGWNGESWDLLRELYN
jgi:nucleoside-diphosphate-sugar epimerase